MKKAPKNHPLHPKQSKVKEYPADEGWEEWGFDDALETVGEQPLGSSHLPNLSQSQRRVVAYYREIGGEIELVFPRPTKD
jgi:hypothetical protein